MSTEKERHIRVSGADIPVRESGSGKPLLYLHGAGGLRNAESLIAELSGHHRVIAPCHPGFGTTELPDWVETVDDIANMYLELLDKLGIEKVDLVGSSLGSWIGAEMACWHPERFGNIVLVGPIGIKVGPIDKLDIPDVFMKSRAELDRLLYFDPGQFVFNPDKMDDATLAESVRNRETLALLTWEPYMHNPKLKHRLQRVKAPTLLIRGEADGLVSADYLASYATLFENGATTMVPLAGHSPEIEQPKALADTILSFFAKQMELAR